MHIRTFILGAVLVVLDIGASISFADEELPWWGYSDVDEVTGEVSYGVTKSYVSTTDGGKDLELRMGFRCYNGEPMLIFDPGRFVGPSSTDFTLLIWIDDNPRVAMDMRVWSSGTNGGFSRVTAFAKRLFAEMRAGHELRWRLDASSWHGTGALSLIGITAASREFAAHCSL